ncbi:MAG: cyclic lactone autoinducer peptide, partial [Eubacteriales bacterium]|nr:cyclic lactone autoinducer peptide [Eubacteriales bacterium]
MKKVSKALATGTKKVLNTVLKADANSASCGMIYQPKAPEALSRFKKTR